MENRCAKLFFAAAKTALKTANKKARAHIWGAGFFVLRSSILF
jgi:hypothetical protein